MRKNLKIITAITLSFSLLSVSAYALPVQTNVNTMNINTSETLIANKTVENLNLINELKVNGKISTEVYDNPTTGYTWVFEVTGDKGVIDYSFLDKPAEVKIEDKASKEPMICGAGTNKILTIKGLKSGKAKLKMSLVRPWEKNIEPAKIMEFEVLVK